MAVQKSRQKDVNGLEHRTYKGCDFIWLHPHNINSKGDGER